MKCSSLSLLVDVSLKFVLLDIKIATLACFLDPFVWKISLYSEAISVFEVEVFLLYAAIGGILFLYPIC